MDRCALVSVNGGWNLAIGTQTTDGGWAPIDVPEACKTVFQEAAKDTCFGAEAKSAILAHPGAWLARAPAKLRVTFDYLGAAPWYLHTANASAFPYRAKVALGGLETVAVRLLLAAAIACASSSEASASARASSSPEPSRTSSPRSSSWPSARALSPACPSSSHSRRSSSSPPPPRTPSSSARAATAWSSSRS